MSARPAPSGLVPLFFLSGATGLVYQVVWLRQLTLVFGATAYASSAVLSTFMGGLALGSWWAGRRADAWREAPIRTYGRLELGIAAYAALVPWLLRASTPVLELAWRQGADRHFLLLGLVKFVAIALLILPATTLMGATLPVLARSAASGRSTLGGGVGALYAANTFGAVFGTVACAFVLLPAFGTRRTLLATVAVNAAIGCIAWVLGRAPDSKKDALPPLVPIAAVPHRGSGTAITVFAASGFGAMVLEVAWTRGLSLVLGSSVYAYASMLTAFLLGLAAGAAAAVRWLAAEKKRDVGQALAVALAAAGVCSLGAAYAIQAMPRLFAEIYYRVSPSGDGWFVVQVVLGLLVMFPTTFALGWVFPLVLELVGVRRGAVASSVGRVYAANTAGTIAGAAVGGFVLLPKFGVATTLVAVAAAQALLGALVALRAADRGGRRLAVGFLAAALGIVVLRPSWDVLLMNSGVYMNVQNHDKAKGWQPYLAHVRENNELVYARDGLTASILVGRQPASRNLYLAVNGKIDASSRVDLETQIMAAHLPLLLHDDPKYVLVVGLASGITAGSAATHPLAHIRIVEVEEAIVEAARCFAESNGQVLDDPRVTLSINDARNELQFNPATYDVIISEPSNPWMTVASNLFTEDFFRIARTRVRPGGIFAQWIQTYSLDPESLRAILAAFRAAFPRVLVFDTLNGVDLLLIGSDGPVFLNLPAIEERMSEFRVRLDLARASVRGPLDVLAMLQTSGGALDLALAGARPNTDDNGFVEFSAPKALYLDSQDANLAMLQAPIADPLTAVLDVVQGGPVGAALRMEMVNRWRRRDQKGRADKAAGLLLHPAAGSGPPRTLQ